MSATSVRVERTGRLLSAKLALGVAAGLLIAALALEAFRAVQFYENVVAARSVLLAMRADLKLDTLGGSEEETLRLQGQHRLVRGSGSGPFQVERQLPLTLPRTDP